MILLTMPYHGHIEGDSAKAFYSGATERPYRTMQCKGSLLAANMNQLWCAALNLREELDNDRWACLHSDVAAPAGWLDTALDVMDETGADIVSVVLPIKDGRGRTSTAIDTDLWRPQKVTMKELMRIPETFGSPDEGNLLVNTGCCVCRFDRPWVENVCFTINDRIIKENGKWMPEVEPEDWNFSRQLHRLGCKVVATRRVQAYHIGTARYENYYAWGTDEHDGILRV